MSAPTPSRPAFISSIVYKDQRAALAWLENAFGFEVSGLLTDSKGNIVHAEMTHGDGVIMISNEFADWALSPMSLNGKITQRLHVRIQEKIDEHCAHARSAGAQIMMAPTDQFYGERSYAAIDFEGHRWTFSQTIKHVSAAEMEQATGFKFSKR